MEELTKELRKRRR